MMKSQHRHDLQTNELADALGRFIEWVRPQARTVAVAAAALVLIIVLLVVLPSMRSRASEATAAAFRMAVQTHEAEAIRTFLDNHEDAEQAPMARLVLADRLLYDVNTGPLMGQPDTTRTAEMLDEAESLYEQVAASGKERLKPLADVGLALVMLERGNLEEGLKALKAIMDAHPRSVAAVRARVHVEALADYEPVVFSDEPLEEAPAPEEPSAEATEAPADGPSAPTDEPPAPPAAAPETPDAASPKPAADEPETPKPVG